MKLAVDWIDIVEKMITKVNETVELAYKRLHSSTFVKFPKSLQVDLYIIG